MFCAAWAAIFAPTASEPVKETLSTPGCEELHDRLDPHGGRRPALS